MRIYSKILLPFRLPFPFPSLVVSYRMSLKQKVVFVDPEDDSCPYWWPALIVPTEYIHLFQQSISEPVPLTSTDLVVCYFEDGSFSVVPEDAIRAFNVEKEPFISYRTHPEYGKRFLADRAVIRALKFCTEGMVPLSFTWLHSSAGADGRLMEHKYSTLEHISTGSFQPKPETRRPSIDSALPRRLDEPPKLEQSKQSETRRDFAKFTGESAALIVGKEEKREISAAQRGRKRKNTSIDPTIKQEPKSATQSTVDSSSVHPKTLHDEWRGKFDAFSAKASLFPSTRSFNANIEYRIIKSLLPPPKSQLIKQILGI